LNTAREPGVICRMLTAPRDVEVVGWSDKK
jgi:hypothetical protein